MAYSSCPGFENLFEKVLAPQNGRIIFPHENIIREALVNQAIDESFVMDEAMIIDEPMVVDEPMDEPKDEAMDEAGEDEHEDEASELI